MNRPMRHCPVIPPLPMRGIRQIYTAGALTTVLLATPACGAVSAYGDAVLSAPGARAQRLEIAVSIDPSFSPSPVDWQVADGSPTVVPVGDPAPMDAVRLAVFVRNPSRSAAAVDVTLGPEHAGTRVTANAAGHITRLPAGMPTRVIHALPAGATERIWVRFHTSWVGEGLTDHAGVHLQLEGVRQ